MRWLQADPAATDDTIMVHPALTNLADEVCGTAARPIAYVVALALFAILGLAFWNRLPDSIAAEPAARGAWVVASRSVLAFAVSQLDSQKKQRLTGYSGTTWRVARMSCTGPMPTAKPWPSSKSTVPAAR
jgi:hypothetical protein